MTSLDDTIAATQHRPADGVQYAGSGAVCQSSPSCSLTARPTGAPAAHRTKVTAKDDPFAAMARQGAVSLCAGHQTEKARDLLLTVYDAKQAETRLATAIKNADQMCERHGDLITRVELVLVSTKTRSVASPSSRPPSRRCASTSARRCRPLTAAKSWRPRGSTTAGAITPPSYFVGRNSQCLTS
jgi:hypothetical protein